MPTESRLCVGLTESRTQHRWVAEYESDSQHFMRRDDCESQWNRPFNTSD